MQKTTKRPQEKKALGVFCPACGQTGTHWREEKDDLLECESCGFAH